MDSDNKDNSTIIEEYSRHLDAIRNLNSVLVDRLKENEQTIMALTEELLYSKREIDELNKEIRNLLISYKEKEEQIYRCQEDYRYQEESAYATTCCNDDYNELRMYKVRPIDKNGNMKK